LLSCLRARVHGADHQITAAFRALPLGVWVATALQVLHMFAVGREGWRAPAGLQGVHEDVDLGLTEYPLLE